MKTTWQNLPSDTKSSFSDKFKVKKFDLFTSRVDCSVNVWLAVFLSVALPEGTFFCSILPSSLPTTVLSSFKIARSKISVFLIITADPTQWTPKEDLFEQFDASTRTFWKVVCLLVTSNRSKKKTHRQTGPGNVFAYLLSVFFFSSEEGSHCASEQLTQNRLATRSCSSSPRKICFRCVCVCVCVCVCMCVCACVRVRACVCTLLVEVPRCYITIMPSAFRVFRGRCSLDFFCFSSSSSSSLSSLSSIMTCTFSYLSFLFKGVFSLKAPTSTQLQPNPLSSSPPLSHWASTTDHNLSSNCLIFLSLHLITPGVDGVPWSPAALGRESEERVRQPATIILALLTRI